MLRLDAMIHCKRETVLGADVDAAAGYHLLLL